MKMIMKSTRWILVGSLVFLLMMGGLGLAMGKNSVVSEQSAVSSEQKEVEPVEVEKAQAEAQAVPETQAIEPKLVMEYKLSEGEEIVDVIFDEATMTVKEAMALGMKGLEQKKATETVKVQYPKVIFTKRNVKFLDAYGKQKNSYSIEEEAPRVNHNQKYIAIYGWVRKEKSADKTIHIFDNNGNKLWEKNYGYRGWSQIRHCTLSKEGKSAIFWGDVYSSDADIYDAEGNLIGKIHSGAKGTIKDDFYIKKKGLYPENGSTFLESGELIVVGVVGVVSNPEKSNFAIICFGKEGEIKWIHNFSYEVFAPEIVRVLPKSKYIISEYIGDKVKENETIRENKYLDIIGKNGIFIHKEDLNKLFDAPVTFTDSLEIKIVEINEVEDKIEFIVSYKNIFQKFDISFGGK